MHARILSVVGATLISVGLSGCWESTDITMHEPGEYKGATDPLLQADAGARSEQLKERFQTVQIDR